MEVPHRLYKYRSHVERDLELLDSNCFWAASIEQLNDPCEAYSLTPITQEVEIIGSILGATKHAVEDFQAVIRETSSRAIARTGVLSLSASPFDELLWAYYANSHKGFCVEYDTEKLTDNFSYDGERVYRVQYSDSPPSLHLNHVMKTGPDDEFVIRLLCNKSIRWKNEQEYRILCEKKGKVSHHYEAITAIYFGARMCEEDKERVFNRMKGRGIRFEEMFSSPDSYKFSSRVADTCVKDPISDLTEQGNLGLNTRFSITSCTKRLHTGRVEVDVLLEKIVPEESLKSIHAEVARTVFSTADCHLVRFKIGQSLLDEVPWAVAQNRAGQLDVRYNTLLTNS